MDGWMDERQFKTHNVSIIVYYARILKQVTLWRMKKWIQSYTLKVHSHLMLT
jgi:hypothetical protein